MVDVKEGEMETGIMYVPKTNKKNILKGGRVEGWRVKPLFFYIESPIYKLWGRTLHPPPLHPLNRNYAILFI